MPACAITIVARLAFAGSLLSVWASADYTLQYMYSNPDGTCTGDRSIAYAQRFGCQQNAADPGTFNTVRCLTKSSYTLTYYADASCKSVLSAVNVTTGGCSALNGFGFSTTCVPSKAMLPIIQPFGEVGGDYDYTAQYASADCSGLPDMITVTRAGCFVLNADYSVQPHCLPDGDDQHQLYTNLNCAGGSNSQSLRPSGCSVSSTGSFNASCRTKQHADMTP